METDLKSIDGIEQVLNVQVATIKDGDTLIFNMKHDTMPRYMMKGLQADLQTMFTSNKVLVMFDTELYILRKKLEKN